MPPFAEAATQEQRTELFVISFQGLLSLSEMSSWEKNLMGLKYVQILHVL